MRALAPALALALLVAAPASAEAWRPIFNGRDLAGWTPKINHRPLGENWRDTFRVEDGVLRVSYAGYEVFKDEFAHLIYMTPLSHYRLRLEYRFSGPQTPGAPAWAVRNSGVMLHGQPPETISLDQSFPISVEAQFLAAASDGDEVRPTGNVCTPGVTVTIAGRSRNEHCITSTSATWREGRWMRFEVEVRGDRLIRHMVNGETVMEYTDVLLAPAEYAGLGAVSAEMTAKGAVALDRGYISLQGEGHPIEFRNIEVMALK